MRKFQSGKFKIYKIGNLKAELENLIISKQENSGAKTWKKKLSDSFNSKMPANIIWNDFEAIEVGDAAYVVENAKTMVKAQYGSCSWSETEEIRSTGSIRRNKIVPTGLQE